MNTKLLLVVPFLALGVFAMAASADAKINLNALKGRILLQVESHGEAWYVNPVDSKRYSLGRPADAFSVMRNLGTGITNGDLTRIQVADMNLNSSADTDGDGLSDTVEAGFGTDKNSIDSDGDGYNDKEEITSGHSPLNKDKTSIVDKKFTANLAGKIFLQVGTNGEAWYVNPVDMKRYFLGTPDNAFEVMRSLGLGITDKDLMEIPEIEKTM